MRPTQIGISPFGVTARGIAVHRITMGRGGLTVSILTLGALIHGVWLDGVEYNLTLNSDSLADYAAGMHHFGTLIGPVVNRLSDGKAMIAGRVHRFETNQEGRHTLHGGRAGTQYRVWKVAEVTDAAVTLHLEMSDGIGGFPGQRRVTARYSIGRNRNLRLEVSVTTDQTTLINFANHSYWNLDGTETWAGHDLQIGADRYLPTTPDFTPTGEIARVTGTPMDFRSSRPITPGEPALDTCFCLSDKRQPLRDVLWLQGRSGVSMTVATTEPGIQVYDGRNAQRPGRGPYEGLAIEAQGWPDAPNHAGFPSIELDPGTQYRQETEWRFRRG